MPAVGLTYAGIRLRTLQQSSMAHGAHGSMGKTKESNHKECCQAGVEAHFEDKERHLGLVPLRKVSCCRICNIEKGLLLQDLYVVGHLKGGQGLRDGAGVEPSG